MRSSPISSSRGWSCSSASHHVLLLSQTHQSTLWLKHMRCVLRPLWRARTEVQQTTLVCSRATNMGSCAF